MSPSPTFSLSSQYLFWSPFSPFGSMCDLTAALLGPFATALFSEMPECFIGCATESQTLNPSVIAV